ncbi:BglG family transcription antiterminator LicT [Alkalihalobacillus sp. 1P02AB]|uniref:BglG family transcription antiterminator LicT n=1 Tax=Alkalihalobacillus sp. 1P02AB TaxID=3132260 RepID=UPI0039A72A41
MDIKKVLNNNVVLTESSTGNELVVMGRGIAFQRKVGDQIDQEKIEKTFVLGNHGISDKLVELLQDIPDQYLAITDKIISYAKLQLPYKVDDHLYVSLTDHISFAITRYKQGLNIKNALLWEIKKFYKQEFQIGEKAIEFIEEETGIKLGKDEAGSIALHLVNSQVSGEGLESMVAATKMVNNILNIVKYYYRMDLDEKTINYERFLTHLRFFALRYIRKEADSYDGVDGFLFDQVKQKYEKAFSCTEKIATHLAENYDWKISNDERVYLTLHVHRVTLRAEYK